MRQIVLDTETTGLEPTQGHRIIEIGCVELINRRITENRYHQYLNPDREIDAGAVEVHGITTDFLADKPRFANIVDDFINFIRGAELIIHNAPFDVGFINNELKLLGQQASIDKICTVTDTLVLARKMHPGQKNSLDALCKRYNIDNSQRELHGALLDAEILAETYLAMTGGQTALSLGVDESAGLSSTMPQSPLSQPRPIARQAGKLRVIHASAEELSHHQQRLEQIDASSSGSCVWLKSETQQS